MTAGGSSRSATATAFEAALAVGHPDVAAHEVHEVGALQQQVGHPGVVVAVGRDVAVGALLGLLRADGVRHERAERLAAVALGRHGLLHVVVPRARLVLRADQHGAGRAHRRDAVLRDGAVLAEHERRRRAGPGSCRPSSSSSSAPRCGASASCGSRPSRGGSRSRSGSTRCGRCSRSSSCSACASLSGAAARRPTSPSFWIVFA